MTEQEKERSPEELHGAIRQLYFHIPQTKFDDEPNFERLHRLRNSELKPVMAERFDELISRSSTTLSYKLMMRVLINRVLSVGRSPDPLERIGNERDQDLALFQSLNLDSEKPIGIFSVEGAKRAEYILYRWTVETFSESIGVELNYGRDPWSPEVMDSQTGWLPEFTLRELKDFILNWWNEYKTLYGQPLIDETEQ